MSNYYEVDIGSAPNSKAGDPARVAFKKINDNFEILFSVFANQIFNVDEDFDAEASGIYLINTTHGTVTATLPALPKVGTIIRFIDSNGQFGNNPFNINTNGNRIEGQPVGTIQYTTNYTFIDLFFASAITGWIVK